jgi:hypothetical protein
MALSLDVVRQVEQDLLLKADILAYHLGNLVVTDAERARSICDEIITRLRTAASSDVEQEPKSDVLRSLDRERRPNVRLATRSGAGDETEEFILDNLAHSSGLSVQEIVDRFEEAEIAIKRATLVVRLHRMVQAGKLTSRTHGHYVLSEAEHNRRQHA